MILKFDFISFMWDEILDSSFICLFAIRYVLRYTKVSVQLAYPTHHPNKIAFKYLCWVNGEIRVKAEKIRDLGSLKKFTKYVEKFMGIYEDTK